MSERNQVLLDGLMEKVVYRLLRDNPWKGSVPGVGPHSGPVERRIVRIEDEHRDCEIDVAVLWGFGEGQSPIAEVGGVEGRFDVRTDAGVAEFVAAAQHEVSRRLGRSTPR